MSKEFIKSLFWSQGSHWQMRTETILCHMHLFILAWLLSYLSVAGAPLYTILYVTRHARPASLVDLGARLRQLVVTKYIYTFSFCKTERNGQ